MECWAMPIHSSIVVGSVLIGPLGPISAGIFATLGAFRVIFVLLSFIESVIVRFLILRVWKRHPPINEDFFALFALVFNYTLSAFFALFVYMSNGQLNQQWILMGKNPDEIPEDIVRFRITGFLILVAVTLIIAMVSRVSAETQ